MKKKSRNTRRVKKRDNRMNTSKNMLKNKQRTRRKNKQRTRRKNKQRTRRKNKQRTRKKNKVLYSKKYNSDKRKIINNYTGGAISQSLFNLDNKSNILVKVMPGTLTASWHLSIPVNDHGELEWPKKPSREPSDDHQFLTYSAIAFNKIFKGKNMRLELKHGIIIASAYFFYETLKDMEKYLDAEKLDESNLDATLKVNKKREKIKKQINAEKDELRRVKLWEVAIKLGNFSLTGTPRTLITDLFIDLFELTSELASVLEYGNITRELLYYYWYIFFNINTDEHNLPGLRDKREKIRNLFENRSWSFKDFEIYIWLNGPYVGRLVVEIPDILQDSSPASSPASSVSGPDSQDF